MAVYCAWASISENGTVNGAVGDQTKKEVKCGLIYNFGQTRVYRCKDRSKALLIGSAAKAIANNDAFGYGQTNRTTSYNELKKVGWVVSKVTKKCNIDCSELGACAVNVAYKKALIPSSVYSGNIGHALVSTGLFTELTNVKYLGKSEYIQCGDIIVRPGHHVIVAYTDGANVKIQSTATTSVSSSGNAVIQLGQKHAIDFTGVTIAVDGISGANTNKMKARVLQCALNKDYNAKLVEDGEFGSLSIKALGKHYVTKGEKQYMVTAAEILCELNGVDPNGVEYPGVYGNGLVSAASRFFGDDGLKITAEKFMKLL